jgi:hypothetical protein
MIRIRYDGLLGLCQREYGRGLCGIRIMDISERQQIVEHYANAGFFGSIVKQKIFLQK